MGAEALGKAMGVQRGSRPEVVWAPDSLGGRRLFSPSVPQLTRPQRGDAGQRSGDIGSAKPRNPLYFNDIEDSNLKTGDCISLDVWCETVFYGYIQWYSHCFGHF